MKKAAKTIIDFITDWKTREQIHSCLWDKGCQLSGGDTRRYLHYMMTGLKISAYSCLESKQLHCRKIQ